MKFFSNYNINGGASKNLHSDISSKNLLNNFSNEESTYFSNKNSADLTPSTLASSGDNLNNDNMKISTRLVKATDQEETNLSTLKRGLIKYDLLDQSKLNNYLRILANLANFDASADYKIFVRDYRQFNQLTFAIGKHGSNSWFKSYDFTGKEIEHNLKSAFYDILGIDNPVNSLTELKIIFNEFIIKLAQCDHKDFSGLILIDLDFSNKKFVNCNFRRCNFNGANLSNTEFINCHFYNCSFMGAKLKGCFFTNSTVFMPWFKSIKDAAEISMRPFNTILTDRYIEDRNYNPIIKENIFSIVNATQNMSNEELNKLENLIITSPTKNGIMFNRECLIEREIVTLNQACVIKEPTGALRMYTANTLWEYFQNQLQGKPQENTQENPLKCPLRNEVGMLKFLTIEEIYELYNLKS